MRHATGQHQEESLENAKSLGLISRSNLGWSLSKEAFEGSGQMWLVEVTSFIDNIKNGVLLFQEGQSFPRALDLQKSSAGQPGRM